DPGGDLADDPADREGAEQRRARAIADEGAEALVEFVQRLSHVFDLRARVVRELLDPVRVLLGPVGTTVRSLAHSSLPLRDVSFATTNPRPKATPSMTTGRRRT